MFDIHIFNSSRAYILFYTPGISPHYSYDIREEECGFSLLQPKLQSSQVSSKHHSSGQLYCRVYTSLTNSYLDCTGLTGC